MAKERQKKASTRKRDAGLSIHPFDRHGNEGRLPGSGTRTSPQKRGEKPYKILQSREPTEDHYLRALVPPFMKRFIIEESREKGMSISSFIRYLINKYQMEKARDG